MDRLAVDAMLQLNLRCEEARRLPSDLIKANNAAVQRARESLLIDAKVVRLTVEREGRIGNAIGKAAGDGAKVRARAVGIAIGPVLRRRTNHLV